MFIFPLQTYNIDHQVADSAGTATAFLCGVKARYGTVGLGPGARRGDCRASQGHNVTCILELAQRAGWSSSPSLSNNVGKKLWPH